MKPRILVIAKAPAPGRAKTRLCPPCTPREASQIAEAALRDTLDAAASVAGAETVLVLDGRPASWMRPYGPILAQRGGGLDERLAAAFEDAGAGLLIGMDTPQVTPELLSSSIEAIGSHDAVLGPAVDGGWWAIGLRRPDPGVFVGVPMSTPDTGRVQRERLDDLGYSVGELPTLRDVDTFDDAVVVAAEAKTGHFARAVRTVARAAWAGTRSSAR